HRAEVAALAVGRRRRHAGQHRTIETWRADVGRLVVEDRIAAREVKHRAFGMRGGRVRVAIEPARRLPLVGYPLFGYDERIAGRKPFGDSVFEDDLVAPIAKSGYELFVP